MKHKENVICGLVGILAWLMTGSLAHGASLIENRFLQVRLNKENGGFSIQDKRTGYIWRQIVPEKLPVKEAVVIQRTDSILRARIETADGFKYKLTLALDADAPELMASLEGEAMPSFLRFPFPFYPEESTDLLLALKSGLLMPVIDDTIYFKNNPRDNYQYYEGHNGSMPFYGLINKNGDGLMRLIETPNDAGYELKRLNGRLLNQVMWQPQFGKMGYDRRIRYILFDKGGYVAMANRFRTYAEQNGMVKTLREKAKENPNVDKLIGAADLWIQDYDNTLESCLSVAREMVGMGLPRMIFNGKSAWWNNMSAADIKGVNALGYLSSRYDQYESGFDPAHLDQVYVNPSWVQEAVPHDAVQNEDGSYREGWPTLGYDGKNYCCYFITDLHRAQYAQKRISEELKTKPYVARFIDTEASVEWVEDYNPTQLMTRTQSRAGRMSLLNYVMNDAGLVTGSEGLSCYAVPYVDYFEGVGPVEPFRAPLAPGEEKDIFMNFEPGFKFDPKFEALLKVSHQYLVPLWDLVFHDCVVAYPRWEAGVANKFPTKLWVEKGILQNVLYGRPPVFTITPEYWAKDEHKQLIKKIYDAECPVARETGYAQMINHQFLTSNHDVQRTTFDNGVVITVNFGEFPYQDEVCDTVEPWGYKVQTTDPKAGRQILFEGSYEKSN